jgi:uncharacterized membrane protein
MYNLLVVVHILSVIAWVGGGLVQQLAVVQARKAGGPVEVDRYLVSSEWMQRFIYIPAPILVLLSGVTMVAVSDSWSFSQTWVYLALLLIVLAGVLGGAVGGRLEKRVVELREQDSVAGPEYADTLRRILNNGWVELVLLVAIIFLMVYKPL